MRKLLIATVVLVLLIAGLYTALPAIAEYSVRQALSEHKINAHFTLRQPSFNRLVIEQLKLEKNTSEQSFTLTADTINLQLSLWSLFNTGRIHSLDIEQLQLDLQLKQQTPLETDQSITATALPFPPLPSYILAQIPADSINLLHYKANITLNSNTLNSDTLAQTPLTFAGSASASNQQLNIMLDQVNESSNIQIKLVVNDEDEAMLSVYASDAIALQTQASLSYQSEQLKAVSQTTLYPEHLSQVLQHPSLISEFESYLALLPSISGSVSLAGESTINLQRDNTSDQHHYRLNSVIATTELPSVAQLTVQQDVSLTLEGQQLTFTLHAFSANGQQLQLQPQKGSQISTAAVQMTLLKPQTVQTTLSPHYQLDLKRLSLAAIPLNITLQPVSISAAGFADSVIQIAPINLTLSHFDLSNKRFQANLISQRMTGRYGTQALPQISLQSQADLSETEFRQRFTLRLDDSALTQPSTLSGVTTTVFATGHTRGNWKTALPLTGIEKLMRRFTTAIPPELVFTAGTLSQQGWLDINTRGIALRLYNQTEKLNLSYDQTHLYDINWHSETIKTHRGKLDDSGELTIAFIDAGVPLEHFSGDYRFAQNLAGQQQLQLDSSTVDLLGGTVTTLPVTVMLDEPNLSTAIAVTGIDLAQLIALEQQQGLSGSGTLNGQMPIHIANGELSIIGGQIISTSDGGWIRFEPPPELLALTQTNQALGIAFAALRNMQYDSLGIELDYQPNGEALLKTHLKGHNPNWNNGRPVDFTINIEENIPKLLQALQFTDKLTKNLEKRYR
ncbi:YdbH domain-containing protein [Amphritea sp. 1_MG-2023]|uniref:YdbH domain-containing protein n=1 Tax=Amphritea sp. 1_MG-2023 TaxID=3062670 RepID=UPI0026E444B1|nr:YdbH domain-containing protein [Amphritea sp. 1_MG-2023]MDO6564356.1 YdbH domain-containing protein [Amphritea sp. 1_MG-2023]